VGCGARESGQAETSAAVEGGGMTHPTETQLVEMEQRAFWLLAGIEIQRTELDRREDAADCGKPKTRPSRADYKRVDTQEAIARDVLLLVGLVRQSEKRGAGVLPGIA
jgi:hypothetical protein